LRPMITGCPTVVRLKCAMSSFKRHGSELLIPIPRCASVATTMVSGDWIMEEFIVEKLSCYCSFMLLGRVHYPCCLQDGEQASRPTGKKAELSTKYGLEPVVA
jgi:hypothetical protein